MTAPLQQSRESQFAALVDFGQVPMPAPDHGVVAGWPDITQELEVEGWRQIVVDTWYQAGGGVRSWVLARGTERLLVKIFAAADVSSARAFAKRLVISPTTPEIPYEVAVDGETVTFTSVSSSDAGLRNDVLIRLYRNVVFDVRAFRADFAVARLADELLGIALQHRDEVLSASLPPLAQPELPPELTAGHEVAIAVPDVPDEFGRFAAGGFHIHVQTGEVSEFTGYRDRQAHFVLRQPGQAKIQVAAVDQRTLMPKAVVAAPRVLAGA